MPALHICTGNAHASHLYSNQLPCVYRCRMTGSAFRLNLLLHSNSVDATISLHGLLVNFNSTTDPTSNVTTTTTTVRPVGYHSCNGALHLSTWSDPQPRARAEPTTWREEQAYNP